METTNETLIPDVLIYHLLNSIRYSVFIITICNIHTRKAKLIYTLIWILINLTSQVYDIFQFTKNSLKTYSLSIIQDTIYNESY